MTACVNNIAGNGRNSEIADDGDRQKYQISRIGIRKKWICISAGQLQLHHVELDLCRDGPEYIGDGKPHEHIDISRQPLPDRMLKTIEHTEAKDKRAENGEHDQ